MPGGFDAAACVEFTKASSTTRTDATKAPQFVTPLAAAVLPAAPITTFTWTAGKLSMVQPPTFWQELKDEFALEKIAHAGPGIGESGSTADAGSTLTADAYVLVFRAATASADGSIAEVLRVMTVKGSFKPTDAQWTAMQKVGALQVSIYGMHFDSGKIVGGVVAPSQARAFSIAQ
jgi:hypothetical protein